jgi:DNA-binding transcriptional LysR family regulator
MDHKLEIFVITAEQRSFTRAAELLHLTPSAVSLSIKALEKKLGAKLFNRTNKHVELSDAGQLVYSHAKEILFNYASMKHELYEMESTADISISIGAAYTFGEYFLPGIMYAFSKRYPNILLNVTIQNSKAIAEQVHKQELDIGFIVEGETGDLNLDVQLFSEDEMIIITRPGHPLIKSSVIDKTSLEAETWIIREDGSGTREITDKFFSQLGISPKRIMSFGSSQTIKESVALGLGISYLSESTVKREINQEILGAVNIMDYANKSSFYYITPQSKLHSQSTKLFKDFLASYIAQNASLHAKKHLRGKI